MLLHYLYSCEKIDPSCLLVGPYWCAKDFAERAYTSCMVSPVDISVSQLVNATYMNSSTGTIDALHNLKNAKVFLFSGTLDTVVHPGIYRESLRINFM